MKYNLLDQEQRLVLCETCRQARIGPDVTLTLSEINLVGTRASSEWEKESAMSEKTVRILLVEDEMDVREILERRLDSLGYFVAGCRNGEEALDMLDTATEPFDMAIIDLGLPIVRGEEAISHIRANPATSDLPILCLTGGAPELGMEAGADHFLLKPYGKDQLAVAVEQTLRMRTALRDQTQA